MILHIELLRPDDLLHLQIDAHNLQLDTADHAHPRLVRADPQQPAHLVVRFPPQCFAEEALVEAADAGEPSFTDAPRNPGDLRARMSGASQLAFRIPDAVQSIPYTLEGLLDWSALEPSLTSTAAIAGDVTFPGRSPTPKPPAATETAIELPYRLVISPGPGTHWRHSRKPVGASGRTELWHTRLVAQSPEPKPPADPDAPPPLAELDAQHETQIRALWSPDYGTGTTPPPTSTDIIPFRHSVRPNERFQLVRLMSTFDEFFILGGRRTDRGKPAQARRLMLSSLGGFLDVHGDWPNKPANMSLIGWEHQALLGRDQYVRVVHAGRLFPCMHRATLVRITERRFETSPATGSTGAQPTAYLRQFEFIVITEPEVAYNGEPFQFDGRELPFVDRIRINTSSTPKLDPIGQIGPLRSREIRVGGKLFPFSLTGVDSSPNGVDFHAALIFIPDDELTTALGAVVNHYRNVMSEADKAACVADRRVTLAPAAPGSNSTTFTASAFHFDVQLGGGKAGFRPVLAAVDVRVPTLEMLTGKTTPTRLTYYDKYLENGFDPVCGVFAAVAGTGKLPVGFAADQAGGIVRPDLSVRGFSRGMGPIAGDLGQAALGTLNPSQAFESVDANLFGALSLKDLIVGTDLKEVSPKITTTLQPSPAAPTQVETRLEWLLRVQQREVGPLKFTPQGPTRLNVKVIVTRLLTPGGAPTTLVTGTLNDFTLTFAGVIEVSVAAFTFNSATGTKTAVNVALGAGVPIRFLGALDFIHKLTEILPPGIFGDNGPSIELAADHVAVRLALSLPPLTLGVFSIRHLSIASGLTLPFLSGRPSFSFSFATREKPFELAVLIFGGGGFVGLEVDTQGIRVVEGMLEFGGLFSLDVGVASGSVHCMAGIYFAFRPEGSELTGFVSVGGEVTVLAIISVSIEFNLSLTYYVGPKIAKGVASVTLSVRIAFISKSVTFSVERSFSAGSEHLSIGSVLTPAEWQSYAEAFA